MKYVPVVLFVYKRPEETRRTLDALAANEGAEHTSLIVYSDGPEDDSEKASVEAVREIIRKQSGFSGIVMHSAEKNLGLANSVIRGVTETIEKYGSVIVLEDDLITSKYFLRFMNEALEKYQDDERICSIHGFAYPSKHAEVPYFLRRGADCWGWATWKRGWQFFSSDSKALYDRIVEEKLQKEFDRDGAFPYTKMLKDQADGKLDSWAVRWYASAFLAGKYTLQSNRMLVENIGFGKNATHCSKKSGYMIKLSDEPVVFDRIPEYESSESFAEYKKILSGEKVSLNQRTVLKMRNFFRKIFK